MNLHCGLGDWMRRMDRVIDEIERTNPDVIGLQEVCHNSEMNMQDYILKVLETSGYKVASLRALDTHRSFGKYMEQLLIISRHQAMSSTSGHLPGIEILRNGYVALELQDFWVVTTHLHFLIPSIRWRQYQSIESTFRNKNVVVFGDMNSSDRSWESGPFKNTGWASHYNGPTYPSDQPRSIFDGFWISPSLVPLTSLKSIRRVFLNEAEQPSDHLGLEMVLDHR
jgi:endonuclease/exonuclease/phosphatase family metal-dependent hydrolase